MGLFVAPSKAAVGAELVVEREGIRFWNEARDRVRIEIDVENRGEECSTPTSMRVETAPFGVFVPWQPLATLAVPAIEPGGRFTVATSAWQPRPDPIGGFSDFIPRRLRTAGGEDERRRAGAFRGLAGRSAGQRFIQFLLLNTGSKKLPPSLMDMLGQASAHWVGNLNVWIGSKPVERHMAPRLRVHAGRTNLAIFQVGLGPEAYAFRLAAGEGSWDPLLFDLARGGEPVRWSEARGEALWYEVSGIGLILFALRIPEFFTQTRVDVEVTKRSTGRSACVEFDLDPSAQGPGCYAL